MYDFFHLPFEEYLVKYYDEPKSGQWDQLQKNFIEPAFELTPQDYRNYLRTTRATFKFPIDNTNVVSVYNQCSVFNMPEELRRFVTFLCCTGFFDIYEISIEKWLNSSNWQNPKEESDGHSILEILTMKKGYNMLKSNLPGINWFNTK